MLRLPKPRRVSFSLEYVARKGNLRFMSRASPSTMDTGSSGSEPGKLSDISEATSWGRVSLKLHQDATDPSKFEGHNEVVSATGVGAVADEGATRNPAESYVERIAGRVDADPVTALLQVNQEVQEEMAMALGRTGTDLKLALDNLFELLDRFERLAQDFEENKHQPASSRSFAGDSLDIRAELKKAAFDANTARDEAEQRRIYLVVHRQSLGFMYKNEETVFKTFPLPPRITDKVFQDRFGFSFRQ